MKVSNNRQPFSKTWLEDLDVPDKAHVHYYDSQCSALALRVTPSGAKSYKAFNRKGAPQFIPIAELSQITLDDARLRALEILRNLHNTGMTPKQLEEAEEKKRKDEEKLNVSLGVALSDYTTTRVKPGRKRSIKVATANNMNREVRKYLASFLKKPLRTLNYSVLNRQHEEITDNHGPFVADRIMRNVSTLINFIEERDDVRLFEFNPASKVLRLDGHEPVFRESHLPAKRFPSFFEAVETMDENARDFLLISIFTGLRAGSIRTLRWDLIDLQEQVVVLTVAKGKKNESMRLPLSGYVVQLLSRRKAKAGDAPFVFPHPNNPKDHLHYHDIYMDWLWRTGGGKLEKLHYHACDCDGKPRYDKRGKPVMGRKTVLSGESAVCNQDGTHLIHHDLRRTFCSIASGEAGVDVFTAMRLSLHECGGGASTVHWKYVQLEMLRPGLERITEAILRLGKRPTDVGGGAANVVPFPGRKSPRAALQVNSSPENAV